MPNEVATLAGGCFWCLEAVFVELSGVSRVESGYAGGGPEDATYDRVSTGITGHAETVQITYDPAVIVFRDLLTVFFAMHDPTTPNRQGADVGSQYRSVIFYHGEEQERMARDVISELERDRVWDDPIVTELLPYQAFYKAEEHHQHFYARNPDQPYCRAVINPKLAKLRTQFLDKLRKPA